MRDQEIIGLWEAYQQVHSQPQEEVETLDEDAAYDRNRKRAAQRAAARNAARDAGQTGAVPGVGYVTPRRERETYTDSTGTVRHKSGAKMPKKEDQKESFDLFDTILEYLVAEGYADTNEAATAIMVNMSEEWRDSIVEDIAGNQYTPNPIGNAIKTGAGLIKKVLGNSSSGGTSTKPGDGKPYPDGPLWDGGGPKTSPKPPVKKGPADRDEPLW